MIFWFDFSSFLSPPLARVTVISTKFREDHFVIFVEIISFRKFLTGFIDYHEIFVFYCILYFNRLYNVFILVFRFSFLFVYYYFNSFGCRII